MSNSSPWQLDGHHASLDLHGLVGQLDLDQPHRGLFDLAVNNGALSGDLWGWFPTDHPSDQLACDDAYIRGDDLVVSYLPSEAFPFHTEFYWRANRDNPSQSPQVSLIVSIETMLLDTMPEVTITSTIKSDSTTAASEALTFAVPNEVTDPIAVLQTLSTVAGNLFQMVHPTDRPQGEVDAEGNAHWRLFAHFLEKGVIRRARLNAQFLPSKNANELCLSAYQEFASEELPLTT